MQDKSSLIADDESLLSSHIAEHPAIFSRNERNPSV